MRKRIVAIAVGATLVALPGAAIGAQREASPLQLTKYEKEYHQVRQDFIKKFGLRKAGRDKVRDGILTKNGQVRVATRREVTASTDRMKAALNPAEPAATATTATTSTYSSTSSSTVMCESGGDYSANTGNGFY